MVMVGGEEWKRVRMYVWICGGRVFDRCGAGGGNLDGGDEVRCDGRLWLRLGLGLKTMMRPGDGWGRNCAFGCVAHTAGRVCTYVHSMCMR